VKCNYVQRVCLSVCPLTSQRHTSKLHVILTVVVVWSFSVKGKGKGFPNSLPSVGPRADPGVQAVSPQVTTNHPPCGRLPLMSARPAVTFPAAKHHHPWAGTKLYCIMRETHRWQQLAQGCYAAFAPSRIWTHDLLIASPTLRHHAPSPLMSDDNAINYWHINIGANGPESKTT